MTTDLSNFHGAIVRQLAAIEGLSEGLKQRLLSSNIARALEAAQETIRLLAAPAKLIVETNGHGDPQRCVGNRPVELTMLRRWDDLARDQDREDDLFVLEVSGEVDLEAFASRLRVELDSQFVVRACAAVDEHLAYLAWQKRVWAEAEKGLRRVFRVEWLEGYEPRDPELHHVSWFTPERGFDQNARNLLLAIAVGSVHDSRDVFDRVRVTRVS